MPTAAPTAHARTTDPDTSHQAAASVANITRLQANVLALFHYAGDMTDTDLWDLHEQMVQAGDYPPASESGVRTRRKELVTAGRLVDTGRRNTNATQRAAIVWGLPPGTPPRATGLTLIPKPRAATRSVLDEVFAEIVRSEGLHGDQSHLPDGTGGLDWQNEARDARIACQAAFTAGHGTWLDIAFEEVAEAFAEAAPARVRAEVIQIAAVCVKWATAIDSRPPA